MAFSYSNKHEQRSFEVLPADNYKVQIVTAGEEVAKSGKNMIKLECRVISNANGDETHKDKTLFYYIVEGPYAEQNIGDIFLSCGYDPTKLPEMINANHFVNLTGEVKTKITQYKGEDSASIHYWLMPQKGVSLKVFSGDNPYTNASTSDDTVPNFGASNSAPDAQGKDNIPF